MLHSIATDGDVGTPNCYITAKDMKERRNIVPKERIKKLKQCNCTMMRFRLSKRCVS